MDILHKLRILFWLLVVGLWGIYMYQYISEDLSTENFAYLEKNPFAWDDVPEKRIHPEKKRPPQKRGEEALLASLPSGRARETHLTPPIGTGEIKEIPAPDMFTEEHAEEERQKIDLKKYKRYPEPPEGFGMKETRHFVIYEEGGVRGELAEKLEGIHGEIMLDLIAFSPWTRERKVFIYYCHAQTTYQRLTGRPPWSGGTSSLSQRKIFVYESSEALSILSHELTHIYFDSFFLPKTDPLWLSEGMAVYEQVQRAKSPPVWLKANMRKLEEGAGYKLKDLMRIKTLEGADEDSVRLWYAQSYSIVKFLMRMKAGDAFYQFCKYLKEGKKVHSALYRAYGMPFNRVEALEYAWRYDLKTRKISGLNR